MRLANCWRTKDSMKELDQDAPQALLNEPTAASVSAVKIFNPPSIALEVAAAVIPCVAAQVMNPAMCPEFSHCMPLFFI